LFFCSTEELINQTHIIFSKATYYFLEVYKLENERVMKGAQKLKEVCGVSGERVIASLEGTATPVAKYMLEFVFGDIFCRDGLSLPEREMITTVCLLAAGGCEPQLEVHINGSLNVGMPPEKIIETFIQCVPYTGYPKVINAINVAKKVFAERKITINN